MTIKKKPTELILNLLSSGGEMSYASIVRGTSLQPGATTKALRTLVKQGGLTLRVEPDPNKKDTSRSFYRLTESSTLPTT